MRASSGGGRGRVPVRRWRRLRRRRQCADRRRVRAEGKFLLHFRACWASRYGWWTRCLEPIAPGDADTAGASPSARERIIAAMQLNGNVAGIRDEARAPPRWLRNAHVQSVLGSSPWRRQRSASVLAAVKPPPAATSSTAATASARTACTAWESGANRGLALLLHGWAARNRHAPDRGATAVARVRGVPAELPRPRRHPPPQPGHLPLPPDRGALHALDVATASRAGRWSRHRSAAISPCGRVRAGRRLRWRAWPRCARCSTRRARCCRWRTACSSTCASSSASGAAR